MLVRAALAVAMSYGLLSASAEGHPALAQEKVVPGTEGADGPTDPGSSDERQAPYSVDIRGDLPDQLRGLVEQSSQLISLEDKPPASYAALRRRVGGDVERFRAALRSEGYYAAEIGSEIDREASPPAVTITIEPGPAYTLEAYAIDYEGDMSEGPELPASGFDLDIEKGARAKAQEIVTAQQSLMKILGQRGRPLAEVTNRRSVVNHATRSMEVTLSVDPGPLSTFGPLEVSGLERTERDYIDDFPTWEKGAYYDSRKVDQLRRELNGTGLFDSVIVSHSDEPREDGALPIRVEVVEGPPRSIGGGASYSTGEGFALEAFWEHRNFLGQNEKLRLRGRAGELQQSISASAEKPRYLRPDQSLLGDVNFSREDTDAYEALIAGAGVGLSRRLNKDWRGQLGLSAEIEDIDDDGEESLFFLLGAPLELVRDTRNSILDPTRGSRLLIATTPYVSTIEAERAFVRNEIEGSAYVSLDEDGWIVLAGRGRAGTIFGADNENIPATKRFYAGGGGSVRGYEFQRIGPLDDDLDPIGGASTIELTAELRLRVTEEFGFVPFLDGGSVYEDAFFTGGNDTEFRWAAGLGLRYFTAVGPIRLDVALPINKREGVDDDFQFYISIGQSF